MVKGRTLMVIGLGMLGAQTLEYLAVSPEFNRVHDRLVGADMDGNRGARIVNLARAEAYDRGLYPNVEFRRVNLRDVDETAEVLKEYEPDLVYQCATLMSWWVPRLAPPGIAEELSYEAAIGSFVACHVALLYKLMLALKRAGLKDTIVVNASIPDITAPMLARKGLGYACGIGNIANYAPRLKYILSRKLKVPARELTLYWYAPHGVLYSGISRTGTTLGYPYYLKVYVGDRDVTEQVDPGMKTMQTIDIGWKEVLMPTEFEIYNHLIAQSAYSVIMGIWNDSETMTYAPGPNGLPGGWTVKVNAEVAKPIIPDGATLDEIVKIEEKGLELDGVEKIKEDGTLVIREKSREIIKKHLGLDYKEIRVEDAEELADKIVSAMKMLSERQKQAL